MAKPRFRIINDPKAPQDDGWTRGPSDYDDGLFSTDPVEKQREIEHERGDFIEKQPEPSPGAGFFGLNPYPGFDHDGDGRGRRDIPWWKRKPRPLRTDGLWQHTEDSEHG